MKTTTSWDTSKMTFEEKVQKAQELLEEAERDIAQQLTRAGKTLIYKGMAIKLGGIAAARAALETVA